MSRGKKLRRRWVGKEKCHVCGAKIHNRCHDESGLPKNPCMIPVDVKREREREKRQRAKEEEEAEDAYLIPFEVDATGQVFFNFAPRDARRGEP